MADGAQGIGKCQGDHLGSYGYPTRPVEPYGFCAQCGAKGPARSSPARRRSPCSASRRRATSLLCGDLSVE